MRAPFPYIGGKSSVAEAVWQRLGNPANYVEPFCGSCAVLLNRPHVPRVETVNDKDALLANFWRALRADPEGLADATDWPVNEADLHPRHLWLVQNRDRVRELVLGDPEAYDLRAEAWWVWGLSCWIGGGWCAERDRPWQQRPHLTNVGNGVHSEVSTKKQKPYCTYAGKGVHKKIPNMTTGGTGVHRKHPKISTAGAGVNGKRPALTGTAGKGVHGTERRQFLMEWFEELAGRLRGVRVCCGDWKRVVTPAVLYGSGSPVAVFLDPPYALGERDGDLYASDREGVCVSQEVREWAIEHGEDRRLRIALCGYEGEHVMPESWEVFAWSTGGGFANVGRNRGRENARRERIWFSPGCLSAREVFSPEVWE